MSNNNIIGFWHRLVLWGGMLLLAAGCTGIRDDLHLATTDPGIDSSTNSDTAGHPINYGQPGDFLVPGDAWSGITPEPGPVDASQTLPGHDARAIARWDTVPYQSMRSGENLSVGVVAFHINGIERVEFAVNGGNWLAIAEPQLNSDSGVWEYWVRVAADDYPDGVIELRARIFPKGAGLPRVLQGPINTLSPNAKVGEHSMFLVANSRTSIVREEIWVAQLEGDDDEGDGSSVSPFKSLSTAFEYLQESADGGLLDATVYLKDGVYDETTLSLYADVGPGWMELAGDPEALPRSVELALPDGDVDYPDTDTRKNHMLFRRLKLSNLRIRRVLDSGVGEVLDSALWIDDCDVTFGAPTLFYTVAAREDWPGGIWVTDSTLFDFGGGFDGVSLCRACSMTNLSTIAFADPGLVVNSSIETNTSIGGCGTLSTAVLFSGTETDRASENGILYGVSATRCDGQIVRATEQAFVQDLAFVNVLTEYTGFHNQPGWDWESYAAGHVLLWNVTATGISTHSGGSSCTDTDTSPDTDSDTTGAAGPEYSPVVFEPSATLASPFSSGPNRHISIRDSFVERLNLDTDDVSGILQVSNIHVREAPVWPGVTYGDPLLDTTSFRPAEGSPLRGRITDPLVPIDLDGESRGELSDIGALQSNP